MMVVKSLKCFFTLFHVLACVTGYLLDVIIMYLLIFVVLS